MILEGLKAIEPYAPHGREMSRQRCSRILNSMRLQMSELTRLCITVEDEQTDRLLALLSLSVTHGWEEQTLGTGETRCIVHSGHSGFCRELADSINSLIPEAEISLEQVEELDWVETWKEFFTPVACGRHFLVLPPWSADFGDSEDRIKVLIEPRQAFGTGHHASTALCLQGLSELYERGLLKTDGSFADIGTGSGILGLAAAKLGLKGVGLDIDIQAVDNAVENRALNNISEDAFAIALGGPDKAEGPYDLIFANILAEPLKNMAKDITALLKDGGFIILSGFLNIQAQNVAAAYEEHGLSVFAEISREDWVALVLH